MRKYAYLIFGTLLLSSSGLSQKIFNTKIENANSVTFTKGAGVINIARADSVFIGQIVINQQLKSSLKVKSYSQQKDSTSGFFVTKIRLVNPSGRNTFNVEIYLEFNSPADSVDFGFLGMAYSPQVLRTSDNKNYKLLADQVTADFIDLKIFSRELIFTKIYGVDGYVD